MSNPANPAHATSQSAQPSQTQAREKIAILGGGLGSMTAAFYLTSTPELRARYEVTVYQMGWRLGGKGASGRDITRGDRIQEHGLHMFMGFYENAFRLMRDAYGEWIKQPGNPFQAWTDAFKPVSLVTLQQECKPLLGPNFWRTWKFDFPPMPGKPGDGIDLPPILLLIRDFLAFLKWILHEFDSKSQALSAEFAKDAETDIRNELAAVRSELGEVFDRGKREAEALQKRGPEDAELPRGAAHKTHPLLDALHGFLHWAFENEKHDHTHRLGPELVEQLQARVKRMQPEQERHESLLGDGFWDLMFFWDLLDVGLAFTKGMLEDVLPYGRDGYTRINNQDFRDWLMKHGASESSTWSACVRALYDLAFAYRNGRVSTDNASMPAGAAASTMLNMTLAYKGAPLWTMEAGMGDTCFTPLYQILKEQRGVRFAFFHKVTGLRLSGDGRSVAGIDLDVQARLKNDEYQPLYEVKGFPCWPDQPLWGQLVDGERLQDEGVDFESYWQNNVVEQKRLEAGRDFDRIVLGISIGAFPFICQELMQKDESWKQMVETTATVQTRAVQLWLKPTPEGLGWDAGTTAMTSYAEPLDSWGELSHLLRMENWPQTGDEVPHSVEYFCNVLDDDGHAVAPISETGYPQTKKAQVKSEALAWLDRYIGHIWPKATTTQNPDGLDYNLLVDFQNREGKTRFDFQYWRANVDPTERYVISVPESMQWRKHAGESGFSNLYLAGDWIITRINGGAAEAGIQSGMLCSQAICGAPENIYDPPPPGPAAPPA